MKVNLAFIIVMITSLTGCNTMLPHTSACCTGKNDTVYVNPDCCNQENFQSGYYYNGYQENGWRYCVVKR